MRNEFNHLRRATLLGLVALGLCASSLTSTVAWSEDEGEKPATNVGHRIHVDKLGLKCTSCHPAEVAANVNRPASKTHASCDSADCHAKEFYTKGGDRSVCLTCHVSDTIWGDMAKLRHFPSRSVDKRDFYTEFNHVIHVGDGAVRTGGEDLECTVCHKIKPRPDGTEAIVDNPRHADCATCHNEKHKVTMNDCSSCHTWRHDKDGKVLAVAPKPKKGKARVTQKFQHETHRLDRRESKAVVVSCGTCHLQAAKATRVGEIVLTEGRRTMERVCRQCHKPGQKTAAGKAIFTTRGAACIKCHSKKYLDRYYSLGLPSSH